MRAVILAAGYGTRLYPLTEEIPKPLLEVKGKPLLATLLEGLNLLSLQDIILVTNHRFAPVLKAWLGAHSFSSRVQVIDDGTQSNEERLGAVGDLHLALQGKAADDTLVIAGDNLFGFSLTEFVDFFRQKRCSIVAFHDLQDKEKVRKRYGVGRLAGTKVVGFEEKPAEPLSALAATACYIFHKRDLPCIGELLRQEKADSPGHLVRWLVEKSEVHGFVFSEHWFDIGDFASLEEAEKVLGT